jgi:hypothetical protein
VDDNAVIGNKQLIVPSLGAARISPRDAFMRTIDQIKQISESLKPSGMRVGFHSEADMFKDTDGARPWDVRPTTPVPMSCCNWTRAMCRRPARKASTSQVIRRNPHRVKTMRQPSQRRNLPRSSATTN